AGGPVLPAVRGGERGREVRADRLGFLGLTLLALVEDAEEEDPGQLRDVLHRPGAVGAAQDVADGPDGRVDRLLTPHPLAVFAVLLGHVVTPSGACRWCGSRQRAGATPPPCRGGRGSR